MGKLLAQEFYKLRHKRSTYIGIGLLLLFMLALAVISRMYPKAFLSGQELFTSNFSAGTWIVFMIIAASSTIMTMEFESGMIRPLLYRRYSRTQVLVSKWLTILAYTICLFVVTLLFSFLLKLIFFNGDFSVNDKIGQQTILTRLLVDNAAQLLTVLFLSSAVFLAANLFRSSAVAVSVGIIGYFVSSLISTLMYLAIDKWPILKWNPFNMLGLGGQLNTPSLEKLTQLSNQALIAGNVVYIIIFLGLGLIIFKKRSV